MNGKTTITIAGKAVALTFGYYAVKDFSLAAEKKQQVYYDEVNGEKQLSFIGIAKLLHCGYKCACELREEDPQLTLEYFNDFVEGAVSNAAAAQQLTDALTVFANSQNVKALADMAAMGEEPKKKTVKAGTKKSKRSSSR